MLLNEIFLQAVRSNAFIFTNKETSYTFGFMSRVIVSYNVLISNINNSPCRLYSNIWTWWDSLLHSKEVKL